MAFGISFNSDKKYNKRELFSVPVYFLISDACQINEGLDVFELLTIQPNYSFHSKNRSISQINWTIGKSFLE